MKTKIALLTVFLLLVIIHYGCETEVDEDWSGFGSTTHFPPSYQEDHLAYIMDNPDLVPSCQDCHGSDYDGGTSGVSCLDCHGSLGVTSVCNRCHGDAQGDPNDPVSQAPIEDGAHEAHLTGGQFSRTVDCSNCHLVPTSWASPGHIEAPPTEIVFSGLAVKFGANPVWSEADETCSNTYCHGASQPEWTDDQAECGSCHGLPPPAPHYLSTLEQCVWCHGSVIDQDGNIINPELHVNGAVNH